MGLMFESFLMRKFLDECNLQMLCYGQSPWRVNLHQKLYPFVDDELIFMSVIDTKQAQTKLTRS